MDALTDFAILRDVRAFLFDLDGTLIDSIPAVDRAWSLWAERVGLAAGDVLPHIHGRRSFDSIRALAPHLDAHEEDAWLRALEATDTTGVTALPGAREFILGLPPDRYTYVTSATRDVATARLTAVGLPIPSNAVYGDDVTSGKPDPEPYRSGAARLGFAPSECLAFEDTLAGVRSAADAGCQVIRIGDPTELAILAVRGVHELRVERRADGTFTVASAN
ncbi:MAG: HAD-IA family hydrolase [Fimbriimonadaceae bacterium]|nr:HAD-IA family hydrolase [Fimbriimonadaceae bacterium]